MCNYPRTPKGYRRIRVGECIPSRALFYYCGKYIAWPDFGYDFTGRALLSTQYGYFFVKQEKPRYKKSRKVWKEPADSIFNSAFPVEEMENEDSMGYLAALIEAKYTESEFRKACAVMAKERADAMGENNG